MRFRTIWTIPAMGFGERLRRTRDWAALEIAHYLPRRIRYWTTVAEIGKATRHSPDACGADTSYILKNLDAPKNIV